MSNNEYSFHVTSGRDKNQIFSVNNESTVAENITPPHRPPILSKCPKTTKPKRTRFSCQKIEFDHKPKSDSRIKLRNSYFNSESEFIISSDKINETDLIRNTKDMMQFDDKKKQDDVFDGVHPLDMNISTKKCSTDSPKLKSAVFDLSHVNGSRDTSPDNGLITLEESFTSTRRINLENTFKAEDLLKNLENGTVTQEIDKIIEITPSSKNDLLNHINIEVLEYKQDVNSSLYTLKCKYNFDWPSNRYNEINSSRANTMVKTDQVDNENTNSSSVNKINICEFSKNEPVKKPKRNNSIQTNTSLSVQSTKNKSAVVNKKIRKFLTSDSDEETDYFNDTSRDCSVYFDQIEDKEICNKDIEVIPNDVCGYSKNEPEKKNKAVKRNNSKKTYTSLPVQSTKKKSAVNKIFRKLSTLDSGEMNTINGSPNDCSKHYEQTDDHEIFNKEIEVIPNDICAVSKNYNDNTSVSSPSSLCPSNFIKNKTLLSNNLKQIDVSNFSGQSTINSSKMILKYLSVVSDKIFKTDTQKDCLKHLVQTSNENIEIPNDFISPHVSNNESNSLRDKKTLSYFDNSNLLSRNDEYSTVKMKSKTNETLERKNYEQKNNSTNHVPITVCKTPRSSEDDELEDNDNVSKIYSDNSLNTSIGKPQYESTPWNRPKSPKPLYNFTQSIQFDETTHGDILSDNKNTHKTNSRPISPSNTEEFYQLMKDFNKYFSPNILMSKKKSLKIKDISTSKSSIKNGIIPSKIKNSNVTNTKKQSGKTNILENKSSGLTKKELTQETKANTYSGSSSSESSLTVSKDTSKSSDVTKKNFTRETKSNTDSVLSSSDNKIYLRHTVDKNTLSLRKSTRVKNIVSDKTTMYDPFFEKNYNKTRSTGSNILLTKSVLLKLPNQNFSQSKSLSETEISQEPQICDPSKSKTDKLKKKDNEDKSLLPTKFKHKDKVVKSLDISPNKRSPRGHKRVADFPISGPNAKGSKGTIRTHNK